MSDDEPSAFEERRLRGQNSARSARFLVNAGIPAGLALMGWVCLTLVDLKADGAYLKESVVSLKEALTRNTLSLYSKSDADRDFQHMNQMFSVYEHRLDLLEGEKFKNRND